MYLKKIFNNTILSNPFVRPNLNVKNTCFYLIRNVNLMKINLRMSTFFTKVKFTFIEKNLYDILSKSKLKNQSRIIIRTWTRQCEYILAQRFRRTQQMFCLYNRLWEERALKDLLRKMRQHMTSKSKEFVFGAIGISGFNWSQNKISDAEIYIHKKEFDYVQRLRVETLICKNCHQRRLVDIMLPDVTYCRCNDNSYTYILDNWSPFLERKDLVVWRRLRANKNNYEYKLHGIYNDVTAEDFFQVQIDTKYRQNWDTTAVHLFIIDSDESSNSDIIYWEMAWPRMFSNRDYVFNRRYIVDKQNKVLTIISRSVEHPTCPVKNDKHRVKDYESCMVIRPLKETNEPGIEFSLTYYDDPGVKIPSAVTSWVAIAGMPDFLNKLRIAAKKYRKNLGVHNPLPLNDLLDDDDDDDDDLDKEPTSEPELEPVQQMSKPNESEKNSYWRYFHPYYYLG